MSGLSDLDVVERITVDWCPDCGSAEAVWPGDVCTNADHHCAPETVAYVRADIHAWAVEALERIAVGSGPSASGSTHYYSLRGCKLIARDALAAIRGQS